MCKAFGLSVWFQSVAWWDQFIGESWSTSESEVDDSHVICARNEHQTAEDYEWDQSVSVDSVVEMAQ